MKLTPYLDLRIVFGLSLAGLALITALTLALS